MRIFTFMRPLYTPNRAGGSTTKRIAVIGNLHSRLDSAIFSSSRWIV
ncbi:hypothetical protein D1AOALGA4SA_1281 [Olavius algarvensis Delta 1 endosymbiont]|nr:hypothetical protein D1AOALGA4SA_1281 [Olavius algarvensis Delta 1 endosymbiont]